MTSTQRVQWLTRFLLFANPYKPPVTASQAVDDIDRDAAFITSPRFDWLTVAALAVSILSTIAIYLYHTSGTGVIGDPVLFRLAEHSIAWIPIYRMAMPLLIPLMSSRCRRTYGVFFLALGIPVSANDLLGHFHGIHLESMFFGNALTALCIVIVVCFALSLTQFVFGLIRATNRRQYVAHTFGWLGILMSVQMIFFGLSLIL